MLLKFVGLYGVIKPGTAISIPFKDVISKSPFVTINDKMKGELQLFKSDLIFEAVETLEETAFLNELSKTLAQHNKFVGLSLGLNVQKLPIKNDYWPDLFDMTSGWLVNGEDISCYENTKASEGFLRSIFHQLALEIAKEDGLNIRQIRVDFVENQGYRYIFCKEFPNNRSQVIAESNVFFDDVLKDAITEFLKG